MTRILAIVAVCALVACVLLLASGFWRPSDAAPRKTIDSPATVGLSSLGASLGPWMGAGREPSPKASGGAPPYSGGIGTALLGGWISWADPELGGDYLATRFPRGTLVQLCTPNRCIVRRSNDFGPSAAIDPPRIADLAVLDWERLCGLPRAAGLCRGTVEAIDEIVLPATDTAQ